MRQELWCRVEPFSDLLVLFKNGLPTEAQVRNHLDQRTAPVSKDRRRVFDYEKDTWTVVQALHTFKAPDSGPFQQNNKRKGTDDRGNNHEYKRRTTANGLMGQRTEGGQGLQAKSFEEVQSMNRIDRNDRREGVF